MKQKLSKIIKQVNKENAPPDGWKPKDRVSDIYEIRVAIQNFLEKELDYDITDAGSLLDGSEADLTFNTDTGRYSLTITKEKK